MFYEKLLRLYHLPESCFNLLAHESKSNILRENSDKIYPLQSLHEPDKKKIFTRTSRKEVDANPIETEKGNTLAEGSTLIALVDCFKCNFFENHGNNGTCDELVCGFTNESLSSTDRSCGNFEPKSEISNEPGCDDEDYAG